MNLFLETIALAKIEDAIARGEFDNLPGAGKPLDLSPENDIFNRIAREAAKDLQIGTYARQIEAVKGELAGVTEPARRKALMADLADLQMRRAMEIEKARQGA